MGALERLNERDRRLAIFYIVVAVAALVLTWWNNIDHLTTEGSGGLAGFVDDAFANPAAASFGFDLLLVGIAAMVFMYVEGRRLDVRYYWLYIVLGLAIAISVTFPLFLVARMVRITDRGTAD
jgi:hypothetical protein